MNSGKAIRQKIRDAIKAKLVELGSYVDEELPDYIMVMLANKRSEAQMTQDLDLFLNNNSSIFTAWLFELLSRIEQPPAKSEKKKKKKDKSSKSKSEKAEASSSSHQEEAGPAQPAKKTSTEPSLKQQSTQPDLPRQTSDLSAPVISILPDTNDVLDEELTKEIDADRKRLKQKKVEAKSVPSKFPREEGIRQDSSPGDSSYRQHVIQQRAVRSESDGVERIEGRTPEKTPQISTVVIRRDATASSSQHMPETEVKVKPGERHVEEVLVPVVSRKRKSPGSVLAQVIHHDIEEDSDDEGPAAGKRVASRVRAERRPTLPVNRQANTSLLKRAVSEATASTSTVLEKQAGLRTGPSRPVKVKRTMIAASSSNPQLYQPQSSVRTRGPSVIRISPSASATAGIHSRSMQREMVERDYDAQTFLTVEDNEEQPDETYQLQEAEEEEEEVDPQQEIKNFIVYKNVAVVRSGGRGTKEAELSEENIEEVIEEEDPVVSPHQEADARHIFVGEKGIIADSTQSPDHEVEKEEEEEEEEGEDAGTFLVDEAVLEETEYQEDEGIEDELSEDVPIVRANPKFIVTLEGAKRHLQLPPNPRRKIQKKKMKGFVGAEVTQVYQPTRRITTGGGTRRQYVLSPVMTEEEDRRNPLLDEDEIMAPASKPQLVRYPSVPLVEPLTISMKDSDDEEAIEAQESKDAVSNKSSERCKFWPACKNGDACPYVHPTTPCRTFPHCKFGDKCLYIHPNCKFDSMCTNPACPYTHATRKQVPPVVLHMGTPSLGRPPPRQGMQTICKFHPACKNPQCSFLHPKACRFGSSCSRQGCKFFHSRVAIGSSLKWTKEEKHISQRPFAAVAASPAVPKMTTTTVMKPQT
ncbi:Zinc finger CCCH domain-containing protein 14 [Holothuria leucospilota]|uniref:Zinc finger CCCH domain-containing protein 14 n=1 Tax=Holothuria leucospilota TaxID=206669 RepID=A0A9Q1CFS1_HOLLE|nr:Zinc finger CCCH domain-containing protein 14 [Holothuria leucospilota]